MKTVLVLFLFLNGSLASASCRSPEIASSSFGVLQTAYRHGEEPSFSRYNQIESRIYQHSDEIFGRMYQMIAGAKKHVYIQTWTFQPYSKPTLYLAEAIRKLNERNLKKGKKDPVNIWLMINLLDLQNRDVEKMRMEKFIAQKKLNLPTVRIHVGFYDAKLLGANHVKTVSVDNEMALITGANFSPSNNGKGFFDLGFVVKGDVLKGIDYDFVQTWVSKISQQVKPTAWGSHLHRSVRDCNPILLTRSLPVPNFTTLVQKNSMTDAFVASIRHARKSIGILTPNLNVTPLMTEIASAVARGVKVKIILSKGFTDFSQDLPTRGGNNNKSIKRLHNALKKHLSLKQICQGLDIRWYSVDGIRPVNSTKPPASHAKFMIFDDRMAYFGSANLDNQSFVNSRELALFVEKRRLVSRWEKGFFNPIFDRATVIDECRFAH